MIVWELDLRSVVVSMLIWVWWIVCLSPSLVITKTLKLVYANSPLNTPHEGVRATAGWLSNLNVLHLKIIFTDILYLIRLPWSAVVKPAADLARNGFKVNKNLGKFYYLSVFIAIDSTFIYMFNVYMWNISLCKISTPFCDWAIKALIL